MIDLAFRIEGARAVPFAAVPTVNFRLLVVAPADQVVHAVTLRAQIEIDATRRRYDPAEERRLIDVFGDPDRWSHTLRSLLWTHVSVVVPTFKGETTVDVPVPCTFDFDIAATKYFHALAAGDLPLRFVLSGTVFYEKPGAGLRVAAISSDTGAVYAWPVAVWREVMDTYYPNTAWLCLRRDVFRQMCDFKTQAGLATWEEAVERLLGAARPAESVAL